MSTDGKPTARALWSVSAAFAALAIAFWLEPWGRIEPLPPIPLVDRAFLDTSPVRVSYADLLRRKADVSDFDCYACHEKDQPTPLRFDAAGQLVIPSEHENIVMGHGRHGRNNLCYNCHDEHNLLLLQARDGRELKLEESTPLCGSCHGPTYRDFDAGIHGRTSGYWDRSRGPVTRLDCVNCHNPHAPKFPSRTPAPGPHPLRPSACRAASTPSP